MGKDPEAGKDWGQEEKRATEDELIGWHHRLDGHEFEQTPGDGEGQRSLACCSPWGHRVGHDWSDLACTQLSLVLYSLCINILLLKGFPGSSTGKESTCNAGDPSSIPGLGISPGEQVGSPLQCSWASLLAQTVTNLPAMWETWASPI